MGDTPGSQTISTQLQGIAEQAVRYPDTVFNNLYHKINLDLLREAYRQVRKDGSPGVDKVTAKEYAKNLEENLSDLRERLRWGTYIAPPVERAWLDKEDGGKRPIGKPTFEDKIVQRAVEMVLYVIYDVNFYDFSHGFRKGHSQHQALRELREQCLRLNIGWIVDADVSGFFDNLDHGLLRKFIKRRVNDGGILRLIGKWLKAGVLEGEQLTYPEKGTPQGGVISPVLSNIFLHYVLDDWFVRDVQPRMKGRCFLIRFADDFVIGFEKEVDARRVMNVLPKRFARFGLSIHPEKTRLIQFRKPGAKGSSTNGNSTFNFLGFTHYWARSHRGYWVIKRKTRKDRVKRFLKSLWRWVRHNRHLPLKEQQRMLSIKLRGHYQYYGISGNSRALSIVLYHARRYWRYWLSRRSHKGNINWEKFLDSIMNKFPLPKPRIIHTI
jgi:group II intron reverse transcriptase/maturase